jgi:hypothetical protein
VASRGVDNTTRAAGHDRADRLSSQHRTDTRRCSRNPIVDLAVKDVRFASAQMKRTGEIGTQNGLARSLATCSGVKLGTAAVMPVVGANMTLIVSGWCTGLKLGPSRTWPNSCAKVQGEPEAATATAAMPRR